MASQHPQSRDDLRQSIFTKLKMYQIDDFRREIKKMDDDDLLADLRYDFGYDPDPRKSSWQTREINRLLTKRKEWRSAQPQWIGILIGNLFALAALVVSLIKK
jgi:hypothetical protein